jgi:O-antigen/teichoic acid export membrane protein
MINKKSRPSRDYFDTDHLKHHLGRRAISGGRISVISRVTGYTIQMVGLIVLARLLSPGEFGLVAMVTAITEVFYVFKDLGLSYATIQHPTLSHDQVSTLFWLNLSFGVLVTLVIIAISPAIAWFYHKPQLQLITIVSSLNFVFIGLSTQHLALLQRNLEFVAAAVIEISATFISTVLAISLAWRGWGYWALVSRPLILGLATTLGVWLLCRWRPGRPVRRSGVRPLLKFGADTLIAYVFDYVTLNLDKTLIGRKYGADQIGYYQRAVYLSKFASNSITISLMNVAVATLSKLRDEAEQYRRYYLKAFSIMSFVGMPISVFMFIKSREIVRIVLGPKWDQTATIFSVLALSTGMYLIYNTNGWLHLSLGRSDRFKKWTIGASVVYFIAIMVGLSISVMGVAIAYTMATFLLTIPCVLYAGRPIKLRFGEIMANLWRFLLAAVLGGAICRFWLFGVLSMHPLFLDFALDLAVYAVLYLALLVAFFGSPRPLMAYVNLLKGFNRRI